MCKSKRFFFVVVVVSLTSSSQTGLFSTFWDLGAPYVTLKPPTLWPPDLHRIMYALILRRDTEIQKRYCDVTVT